MPVNHPDPDVGALRAGPEAAPAAPAEASDTLQAELVSLLYTQSPAGILATVPIVVLTALVLWNDVARPLLLAWVGAAVLVTGGRLALIRSYRRHAGAHNAALWERRFLIAAAAGGGLWGLLGAMVALVDPLIQRVFLVFVSGGMAAGAIATMNAGLSAYRVFAFAASAPAVVMLLLQGEPMATTMALMVSVFILLLMRTAHHVHRYVVRAVNLGHENERLVQNLSQSKAHVERVNRSLADEVQERRRREQRLRTQQAALVRLTSFETLRLGDTDGVLDSDCPHHGRDGGGGTRQRVAVQQ